MKPELVVCYAEMTLGSSAFAEAAQTAR